MKRSTLELLCCPLCQAALCLQDESGDGPIVEGELSCSQCERGYPISKGVAQFIDLPELDGLNRQFARSYDWMSHVYSVFTRLAFLPMGGERKARKEILDRLDLSGGRVLEVSIGTGDNLRFLFESPDAGEMYGLDISAGQLERCRKLVNRQGWGVDLFRGTAEALPFKEGSFDNVYHIGGINFFSGKKKAIEEMIRVARAGSKIIIADETERVAQLIDRLPGFSSSYQGEKVDPSVTLDMIPPQMQDAHKDEIWKAHGKPHGYCIEFRKPA
jgi:ubiquinone/menaquinone biosynthesis C-methylase UbiE/uncharacterized protein YbaR (Trm112 family)